MVSQKIEGNTVTWVTKCVDKKGVTTDSTGSVTYSSNSFNGTVHNVTTDSKGAKSSSSLQIAGRRTGDCK